MAKMTELCKLDLFSISNVNALPCETQMRQIVTFRGDYLYPTAHFCITNLTEGTTGFFKFCSIKYFKVKIADNKIHDWWA